MNPLGISRHEPGFLHWLGLHVNGPGKAKSRAVQLAQVGIDESTGGMVAVSSDVELDGKGGAKRLQIKYWRRRPNGNAQELQLIDIDFAEGGSDDVVPAHVRVLGREMKLNDLLPGDEQASADGVARNYRRIIAAVGRIHRDLRPPHAVLPQIAKIFKECGIEESMGEALLPSIVGPKSLRRL